MTSDSFYYYYYYYYYYFPTLAMNSLTDGY